jgi:polyketide biosynthesis enoyl-CoA hydratase PksH
MAVTTSGVVPGVVTVPVPARLCPDAVAALVAALRDAEAASARVLVLRGACSGVGLDLVGDWTAADNDALTGLLTGLRDSGLVTVAVVDGPATGGGVGLAAACDFVVAAPGAEFRLTEVLVGLVPAVVWPFVAARVGTGTVFRAALLATRLDAAAALRLGLADEVADDPAAWLRELVLALRRTPRDVVADLKACRRGLPAGQAYALFSAAVADPEVRRRMAAVTP